MDHQLTFLLPDHVIENILGYDDISFDDIVSFRLYRKEYCSFVEPWESIFFQRWPSAKNFYDKQKKNEIENNKQSNEESFIEEGIDNVKQLRDYVSQIIDKYYKKDDHNIDNLLQLQDVFHLDKFLKNKFNEIIDKPEHHIKYHFFIDEIKKLLQQPSRKTDCDLTERYCYEKIFHYIKQRSLRKEWNTLLRQSKENPLLEEAATIIAQSNQLQKNVQYSDVKKLLDDIALQVMNYLKIKHPNHSIFSTSDEILTCWKSNNIDENYWNKMESTQIMKILEEYIFCKLNFRHETYEGSMCIDKVLNVKKGTDLIILIIYQSVARRLGLRCDVIKLDDIIYCLFWKPKYATKNLENAKCFSINYDDMEYSTCLEENLMLYRSSSAIFRKSANIKPIEMWIYMKYLHQYTKFLSSTLFYLDPNYYEGHVLKFYFPKPQRRNTKLTEVKYAVGMIVEHINGYTNNCIGVIIAWHRYTDDHVVISHGHKFPVNICTLSLNHRHHSTLKSEQTKYLILIETNQMCYVKEDELILTKTPKWIKNNEIGRYFCKFAGTHYEPNQMLANLFPDDVAIRQQYQNKENRNGN